MEYLHGRSPLSFIHNINDHDYQIFPYMRAAFVMNTMHHVLSIRIELRTGLRAML